jgi:hypothetical protein
MQIEIDYKPMSKKDYDTFIRILAKMLADFINDRKTASKEPLNG